MVRDARLYFLEQHDWKPLVEIIEKHKKYILKELVVIYDLCPSQQVYFYAILSMSDDIDKILEEYGAKEADEKDLIRTTLHDYNGEPLYGQKSRVVYLKKIL